MHRRRFLQAATAATAAVSLPAKLYSRSIGSNEKLRVGVIGLRGRGQDHIGGLGEHVVAICDCDETVLEACHPDRDWRRYWDYRKMLDWDGIDAVSIATPNHTHALIAIAAIQAGKDVYVEKPVSHNVWEGRQIVAAARARNAVVQCGTQARSSASLRDAVQFVREENLGRAKFAIGTCFKPRMGIGKLDSPLVIPPTIDYDLWCGPAEKRELYRPNLHYDWHWDFNTGCGDMGNQGIHQMDIARWFLGAAQLSRRVLSIGGRLGYDDAGDTPNTQTVLHQFENTFLIFETRGLPKSKQFHDPAVWPKNMDSYRGSTVGVVVQCEGGHLLIPSDYSTVTAFDGDGKEVRRWENSGDHYANFIQAVQADDRTLLHAEVEEGHLSSALCHTGSISHQLGRPATLTEIERAVGEHKEFSESLARMVKHLSDNGIDVSASAVLTLGADLQMDGSSEQFLENEVANKRLTRDYRKPFEITVATNQVRPQGATAR